MIYYTREQQGEIDMMTPANLEPSMKGIIWGLILVLPFWLAVAFWFFC